MPLNKDLEHEVAQRDKKIHRLEFLLKKTRKQLEVSQLETASEAHHVGIPMDFSTIFSLLPGSIYWKDKNGVYLHANIQAAHMAGLKTVAELVGKTDYDLFSKEQADQFRANDKKVMQEGNEISVEEVSYTPTGDIKTQLSTKKPILDKNGKSLGILGVTIDITEKKTAEQLKAMKSAFIQNMEHDIRTPCSGIWGMVNHLWKTETDPTKKEYLGLVTQAAKELLDYNNRVIEFAQTQAEKWLIINKKFEIQGLCKKAIALEKPAGAFKKINLDLYIDQQVPTYIVSDDHRLYCIMVNLISNAVKFTESGDVLVKLSTINIDQEKRTAILNLTVTDTGIGISKEMQNLIYAPFNRLNPSNTNKYKGLGLGMTMVKQFLEELDGELEIISEENKGTSISCLIPVKLSLVEIHKIKTGEMKNDH